MSAPVYTFIPVNTRSEYSRAELNFHVLWFLSDDDDNDDDTCY